MYTFFNVAGPLGPQLQSYSLNMTSREIVLTFNKNIEPSSVNVTGIVIQGANGVIMNTSLYYRLTAADRVQVVNSTVTIVMSNADYNALQIRFGVATSTANTYLTMNSETVTDRTSHRIMAESISGAHALPVLDYTEDQIQPQLVAFSLNLETTSMSLTFSEPVLISSFRPQQITIASNQNSANAISYQLTGGDVNSSVPASNVIDFHLNELDVINLKTSNDIGIATGAENTYISVSTGLVTDTNGNINSGLNSAITVSNFTADTTALTLNAFELNLTSEALTLHFDDIVNASTFSAIGITLQSGRGIQPAQFFTLDPDSGTTSNNGYTIVVHLSTNSINGLKQMRNLCTSRQNCYMIVSSIMIRDPYGRSNIPISGIDALSALSFTVDQIPPMLISWSLDMNEGVMILSFSETVDITTFQATELTLQSSANNPANLFTLTNYSQLVPADAASEFEVRLSTDDINAIKTNTALGTSTSTSFLSLTSDAISDMSFNSIVPISSNNALPVDVYEADTTAPSLVSFSANFYTQLLVLTFDEVVRAGTFDPSSLRIGNSDFSIAYSLTPASYTSSMDSAILLVTLSQTDLDNLRNISDLATSLENTYLSAQNGIVQDMSGLSLNPILQTSPLQVSIFVDSPILISYANTNYTVREGEVLTLRLVLNTTTATEITLDVMTEDRGATGMSSQLYFMQNSSLGTISGYTFLVYMPLGNSMPLG